MTAPQRYATGMTDARTPDPGDPYEDAGLPATDNALAGKQITGDPQDDIPLPGETAQGVDDYGTTASEQAEGEPLGLRATREEPDVLAAADEPASNDPRADQPYPTDPDERTGRLVQPDEGARDDAEPSEVAGDVGTDAGGFSAEERAMHVEPGA